MDRSEYSSADADYWYNKGKEDERAKIVAWLRLPVMDLAQELNIRFASYEIEAGEHLK
jgi:hypothetical protein